jgi:hypothetical protein
MEATPIASGLPKASIVQGQIATLLEFASRNLGYAEQHIYFKGFRMIYLVLEKA